jgi:hypothetical protein
MRTKTIIVIILLTLMQGYSFAQADSDDADDDYSKDKKGFKVGLFVGALFANQYTAKLYDGYGYDIDGNKFNFENSFMYQKIIIQYGGGIAGQPDYIAQALGVNPGDWSFTERDMPVNMRYTPSFLFGLQMRYSVDKKNAILININGAQLKAGGNFTITTRPTSGQTQVNNAIKTFGIVGGEQRLIIQLGYQRILTENEKVNFLIEGGLNATVAKFDKNQILINDLLIDLTADYNNAAYTSYRTKRPIGTGFGAFAGIGIHITMSEKFTVQLMYNPSYERINIGENRKLTLQNAVGLRMYYNF